MQFYKYWIRENEECETPNGRMDLVTYGYSNQSIEDALQVARERIRANSARREWPQRSNEQYYSTNSPLREEIVQELVAADGQRVIISRNKYGCLVLNTPNVLFADIDQPESPRPMDNPFDNVVGFFKGLFGRDTNQESSSKGNDFESKVVARIKEMTQHFPETVVRLYRTYNGFRAMILDRTIPTGISDSTRLLEEFGTDELYVSLCRSQDCYRARLSPKPWRCKMNQPDVRFPFANEKEKSLFHSWLSEYEAKSRNYATCALIGNFGHGTIDQTCQQITDVHDNFALNQNYPLA